MIDYSQPAFYRFNEDSIKLVKFVLDRVKDVSTILDLGAGSGILGIELANKLYPSQVTFLELQQDFIPYLEENIKVQMQVDSLSKIENSSFGEWEPDGKYDLVISNPPYFLPGHGQRSEDSRKNLARTFEKDSWEILVRLTKNCLSDKGRAFFVLRNDEKVLHKIRHFGFKETVVDNVVILELHRD